MHEWYFVFVYGIDTAVSLFLALFWGRFSHNRRQKVAPKDRKYDRYLILARGLTLNAGAQFILSLFRTISNIHYGLSKALYGWEGFGVGTGLFLLFLSHAMFVWLAELEQDPPKHNWLKWGCVIGIVRGVVSVYLALNMPGIDGRPPR